MILGIDQGTTGSTAILLSQDGSFLGSFTAAVPQHFPQPGWVEHEPSEIWKSVTDAIKGVLKKVSKPASEISVIGITNQRETVSLFDDHTPLHRFIVWQDRRTADVCKKLERHKGTVRNLSGLPIDPYFSATKISYLLKKVPNAKKIKKLRFRTIDSFLFSKFSGEDAIEVTNASRTSLLNLKTLQWDERLFDIFSVPSHIAPPIISSEGFEYRTKNLDFLPDGIPIRAALGDQQAALFGQLGWKKGDGKITYGTGSFILLNTGNKFIRSKNNLVSTVALQLKSGQTTYALEGSAFISGAWIQWLRDNLKMISDSAESEALASQVDSSAGVIIIPALSGMGAPFWKPDMRGGILGLTRGSNRMHIARASLEALCFQNKALIESMVRDYRGLKPSWRVDGGAVKNNLLLQLQANILGTKIIRPQNLEATATGVALLAAYSHQLLSLNDIQRLWQQDQIFSPQSTKKSELEKNYHAWIKALSVF